MVKTLKTGDLRAQGVFFGITGDDHRWSRTVSLIWNKTWLAHFPPHYVPNKT